MTVLEQQSNISVQIAKHFREVFFGGNWTTSNMKEQLSDVSWHQALTRIDSLNTIAILTYHISYFVSAVLAVLQGSPLDASDKLSFSHPPIANEDDWQALLAKIWTDAKAFAEKIAELPEERLWQTFANEKYGSYFRNSLQCA